MSKIVRTEYPLGQTSYIAAFDDGTSPAITGLAKTNVPIGLLAQHELKEGEPSRRSEGYVKVFKVEILDHDHSKSKHRICNDEQLKAVFVYHTSPEARETY